MKKASLMIIVKDGKILSVSRGVGSDLWALPGGKRELGETAEQNAIREVFEETGITVAKTSLVYSEVVKSFRPEGLDFHADCFYADEWSGEIQPSDEGDVEWLSINDLLAKSAFKVHNTKLFEAFNRKFNDEHGLTNFAETLDKEPVS